MKIVIRDENGVFLVERKNRLNVGLRIFFEFLKEVRVDERVVVMDEMIKLRGNRVKMM